MEAMESAEGSSEPAKQKPVTNAGRQYYFVCIKVDADTGVTSAAERSPFVGLQIGLLLGKGAYGRVYKGYYRGNVVAVKVHPAAISRLKGSLRRVLLPCQVWALVTELNLQPGGAKWEALSTAAIASMSRPPDG